MVILFGNVNHRETVSKNFHSKPEIDFRRFPKCNTLQLTFIPSVSFSKELKILKFNIVSINHGIVFKNKKDSIVSIICVFQRGNMDQVFKKNGTKMFPCINTAYTENEATGTCSYLPSN